MLSTDVLHSWWKLPPHPQNMSAMFGNLNQHMVLYWFLESFRNTTDQSGQTVPKRDPKTRIKQSYRVQIDAKYSVPAAPSHGATAMKYQTLPPLGWHHRRQCRRGRWTHTAGAIRRHQISSSISEFGVTLHAGTLRLRSKGRWPQRQGQTTSPAQQYRGSPRMAISSLRSKSSSACEAPASALRYRPLISISSGMLAG